MGPFEGDSGLGRLIESRRALIACPHTKRSSANSSCSGRSTIFSESRLSPTSQPLPTFFCRRENAIALQHPATCA